MKAVNKVVEQFPVSKQDATSAEEESYSIFIKEDQITYQLKTATILYIEAYGNYLKVHTPDKTYVTRETMHEMQNLLPEKEFVRVHKSYIVSLAHIESIMGNRISIKGEEIPVGEMYKLSLKERIGK
jgi:DNA-binding LytR/AlgR family response regulator